MRYRLTVNILNLSSPFFASPFQVLSENDGNRIDSKKKSVMLSDRPDSHATPYLY